MSPDQIVALLFAVGTGIVASGLTLFGDRVRAAGVLRRRFKNLEGRYIHLSRSGDPILNSDGSQRFTSMEYAGWAAFRTKGDTDYGAWFGRLKMDDRLPEFGSGHYDYALEEQQTGVHQVVVTDQGRTIFVMATALSHPENPPNAYLWKRVEGSSGAEPLPTGTKDPERLAARSSLESRTGVGRVQDPSPGPKWDLSEERAFIENLLGARLNFFLVVFSLVLAGMAASDSLLDRALLASVGTLITSLLAIPLFRAQFKLDLILRSLWMDPVHPAKRIDDDARWASRELSAVGRWLVGDSRRKMVGYVIPSVCILTLLGAMVYAWIRFALSGMG